MKNKRYRYYQPNEKDLKDKQGDCSIRALTKFNDSTWVEEFDNLVKYARETQKMLNSLSNIELYMQDNNIPYTSVYKPKARHKITVDEIMDNVATITTSVYKEPYPEFVEMDY